MIVGGDGYATHDDCDPNDAVADLSRGDSGICWICGEPVEEPMLASDDPLPGSDGVIEIDILTNGGLLGDM